MKIFHGLVNYGTQAGMLAKGLRDEGYEAISVVYGDGSNRMVDVNIERDINARFSMIKRLKRLIFLLKIFFNYDIFHFYFGQTLLPYNLDVPFYHLFRKKIVMEYLGTDVDLWLGYNGVDWRGRPVDRIKILKRVKKQSRQFDKQLVCGPYYYEFVDNSIILPLALDLSLYSYQPRTYDKETVLTIMHCPTNRMAKKSDYLEAALVKLKSEGYRFHYKCITNVTHEQLKEEYLSADVIVDQLGFWYGTVSVEAMALGRPVVCCYRKYLLHYDQRYEDCPIIYADIYNIYDVIKEILEGKYNLSEIGRQSREYALKTHDLRSVTKQLIEIYSSL